MKKTRGVKKKSQSSHKVVKKNNFALAFKDNHVLKIGIAVFALVLLAILISSLVNPTGNAITGKVTLDNGCPDTAKFKCNTGVCVAVKSECDTVGGFQSEGKPITAQSSGTQLSTNVASGTGESALDNGCLQSHPFLCGDKTCATSTGGCYGHSGYISQGKVKKAGGSQIDPKASPIDTKTGNIPIVEDQLGKPLELGSIFEQVNKFLMMGKDGLVLRNTWRDFLVAIIVFMIIFAGIYDILTLVSIFPSAWVRLVLGLGLSVIGALTGMVRELATWGLQIAAIAGTIGVVGEIIICVVIFIGLSWGGLWAAKWAARRKGQVEHIKTITSAAEASAAIEGLRNLQAEFRKKTPKSS